MTTGALDLAAAEWERDPDEARKRWPSPCALARALNPSWVQTPALDLIDEALVRLYTTPGGRLLISMPPQEGKTSLCSRMAPLWALICDPERRVGVVSYSQGLAEASGREIRNTITGFSGDGAADLGLRVARDNGAASRWQLDGHRGGVIAAGVGSGLTGRSLDVLVLDDPYADREQADSAYYRARVLEWWQSVGSTRLAPGAPVCVVLTRWHYDDIAARLVAAEDGHRWSVINIPARSEGTDDPLGREPGEWLQSARRRTSAEWEAIKIQAGSRTFNSLYQGKPSPDSGDVWKRHWWRRYSTPLWSQHPHVPGAYVVRDVDEMCMSWDMSFKAASDSDFVVGQVWARRGADVFLLDQIHKRLSFTETVTAFRALVARWPGCHRRLVEQAANGHAVLDLLRSEVGGLVAVKATESKYARASAVAPFLEAGNVLLPDPAIALFDPEGLIDEACMFPAAAHDDQVDATSQALAALLIDSSGAEAWIAWARKMAEEAAAARELPEASAAAIGPPAATSPAVTPDGDGWLVASSSGDGVYSVTAAGECSCPAGQYGRACKHVPAAQRAAAASAAEEPLEGVVVDAVAIRKAHRDEAFRAMRGTW